MYKRLTIATAVAIAAIFGANAETTDQGIDNPMREIGSWPELKGEFVGDAAVTTGDELFELVAPFRAHDAGTVPIEVRQTNTDRIISSMKLIIDENPAPMAADIKFGKAMHPVNFSTRIRVDQYSNVRAIAESPDGELFMNGRFVKASGGCSAAATSDPEVALQNMGKMKLKEFESADNSDNRREVQLMIRHPNYSGLQRDQITHLFVNAQFINELQVFQGDETLFSVEGGISISENPVFRFEYNDDGSEEIRIRAVDLDDNVFEKTFIGTEAAKI